MNGAGSRRTFLLVTQVYVPDPASVGQQMADAAAELARRGHRVVVLTSARGYDDPSRRYARRETFDNVEVRRLPFSSFGKSSVQLRVLAGLLFVLQATLRALFMRRLDTLVVTTTPHMAAITALLVARLRRVRVEYWVMDLNPDQAVQLGITTSRSVAARALEWVNRRLLAGAHDVIVLDRFMRTRVTAKLPAVVPRLHVIPPWALTDAAECLPHDQNAFRARHQLQDKFVVMYSGNHSPANPLTTLLDAASALQHHDRLLFLFIGGGAGKQLVASRALRNVRCLPYQPLQDLRESLSAADVHVVSIGDAMVGVIHPCKVYGAMAVSRPVLLLGPPHNHIADLLAREPFGWHIAHGDVAGTIATVERMLITTRPELEMMGRRGQQLVHAGLSRTALRNAVCNVLEGNATVVPMTS